jgi:ribonuclease R
MAGLAVRRGRHLEIEPLFQSGTALLPTREGPKPTPGDVVLYTYSHGRRVRVLQIVGHKGVLEDVLGALLTDSLERRGFDSRVLSEAAEVTAWDQRVDHYRADLRSLFTFTVDPESARDFDDALSFGHDAEADRVVLYVHIADVSYFVAEGGELDREALRRGNSVYVPTGVEPMLPPQLSAGVCSLAPGVPRKAVTVEMHLDKEARVQKVRFYRSLVESDARLDYGELEQMFRDEIPVPRELSESLAVGRPLARALKAHRLERGAIQIESAEPDFHFDSGGEIESARPAQELESHEFIEDFMLLANEQVALFLERAHVPCVYRVHDQPDPFNLDRLLSVLSALDLPTPVFDPMSATRKDVRRAMRETAEWVERFTPKGRSKAALTQQVLRAQSRAVYETENIGHFGLALASYCHFTSPIRRYPDLLVHRALLAHLDVGPQPETSTLSEWAGHCSRMEREAAKVELKADDIALAHLLRRRLEKEGWHRPFEGQILSLVHAGAFVLFDELYEGFLPARHLPGDYYEMNDAETALVGRRTGAAFRVADFIEVEVAAVDEARGKVDLVLAEEY